MGHGQCVPGSGWIPSTPVRPGNSNGCPLLSDTVVWTCLHGNPREHRPSLSIPGLEQAHPGLFASVTNLVLLELIQRCHFSDSRCSVWHRLVSGEAHLTILPLPSPQNPRTTCISPGLGAASQEPIPTPGTRQNLICFLSNNLPFMDIPYKWKHATCNFLSELFHT